jgi:hypothetical protein
VTRILVLDIEAVRDEHVWSPPADQPDAFAPAFAWRPICIGAVMLEETGTGGLATKRVGLLHVPKDGEPDAWERLLLAQFTQLVGGKVAPLLVTWNGRAFDLPVLMLRSLRHGLPQPWYYRGKDVRYRYSEAGHCDLADAMGDYGASRSLGLDGMARLIGLPGKFGDIGGADVAAAFAAGRHEDIASYCMADAVQKAFLFLRWQLLKGAMTLVAYRDAAVELLATCEADPRLAPLAALVDRAVLLAYGGEASEAAA